MPDALKTLLYNRAAQLLARWVGVAAVGWAGLDAGAAEPHVGNEAAGLAGRGGGASQVNVLVFDPDDEKLVRIRVPMWLAKKVYRIAEPDGELEIDLDGDDRDLARHLSRSVSLEALEKSGPGLLVEVDEDDGEQVLVWLR